MNGPITVNAAETGEKKTGSAKVEQFGGYDVQVAVSVLEDKIETLEIEETNFEGSYADFNKTKLQAAIDGLKLSYTGKSATDVKKVYLLCQRKLLNLQRKPSPQ